MEATISVDNYKAFIKSGDITADERIRSIYGRNALKVDMSVRELRRDVIYIVRHPT